MLESIGIGSLIGLFWFMFAVGLFVGYLISEQLVAPFGLLDVLPFSCRKCCTTWVLLAMYGSVALYLGSWTFFLCGSMLTSAMALCFIITEKEKGL